MRTELSVVQRAVYIWTVSSRWPFNWLACQDTESVYATLLYTCPYPLPGLSSGELRTQKLKSHLVRTQSLNVLPLKPGVGQYIATHGTLTARDFFLAYFYPSGPFTCIFPNVSRVFPVLAVANTSFCVGPQNKIGHPVGC